MTTTLRVKERCLALSDGTYEWATVKCEQSIGGACPLFTLPVNESTVPFARLWKPKKKKAARTSPFFKSGTKDDKYVPRPRTQRFALSRRLSVHVQPVCYGHGFKGGNFYLQHAAITIGV